MTNVDWTWGTMPIKREGRWIEDNLLQAWQMHLEFYLGKDGYQIGDAPFEYVSEGRQKANFERIQKGSKEVVYYGCADLPHTLLWNFLGGDQPKDAATEAKAKQVINRDEAWGWKTSVNVSRLRYSTGKHFIVLPKGASWSPPPLSMCLMGESGTEHVCIPKSVTEQTLVSGDYGQFWKKQDKSAPSYGGKEVTSQLERRADKRLYAIRSSGTKPIIGHLDILSWLDEATSTMIDLDARIP